MQKLIANLVVLTVLILGIPVTAIAAEPINTLEKSGLWGYDPSGIAIRGYDPVAYFTMQKPVAGKDEFATDWMGATWNFSSQEHLELFTADPDKYAPQFGGYCAYGVAENDLVKIEPELWTIVDDKLYLNYDEGVQQLWEKDIPGYIDKANSNFDELLKNK